MHEGDIISHNNNEKSELSEIFIILMSNQKQDK